VSPVHVPQRFRLSPTSPHSRPHKFSVCGLCHIAQLHRETDLSSRGSQSACTGFVSLPAHLRAPGPPEPEPAERANEAALCLFTACPEKSLQRANPADAITHVAVTTACSIHACSVSAPSTHDSLWRVHVNQCSCHALRHVIQNMLSRVSSGARVSIAKCSEHFHPSVSARGEHSAQAFRLHIHDLFRPLHCAGVKLNPTTPIAARQTCK
jgi:hypothetical protein